MLVIGLLILGIVSRLVFHIDNFTPVIALALFGGVYLKQKHMIIFLIALLAITDIILGFHPTMIFTWGSVLLIGTLGYWLRNQNKILTTFVGGTISALLFFMATNFGVWLIMDIYPKTLAGLLSSYTMAIPFFRSTISSTLIYGVMLFGTYEIISNVLTKKVNLNELKKERNS